MKTKTWGLLTLSLLLLLSSCKDPCKDYDCGNGTCADVDGEASCVCDAGYEGERCDIAFHEKFLGTYIMEDTCDGSPSGNQTIVISAGSTNTEIIFNLISGDGPFNGTIGTDGYTFTIPNQTWFNVGTVSGTGNLDPSTNTFVMEYTIVDPPNTFNCIGTATKQ